MDVETPEATRLREGLELLWLQYGRHDWQGTDDVLGVLVRTILSQATTKANTDRAFGQLMEDFDADWAQIAEADVADVSEAIRVGGLAKQKAPRIQAILESVLSDQGEYSLEALADFEHQDALAYLLAYRGVGPKTARFVLMDALGGASFPMDTHIFRILEIWGLLDGSESDAAAHRKIEGLLDVGDAHAAHMVLVRHGREVCKARKPDCRGCTLGSWCPGFEQE